MFAVWRRVLFVSASPLGSAWLDNDGERLAVRGALRGGGRLLLVEDVPKATRVAVIDALKREAPTILHLSCHGWDNRGIVLEDRSRSADPVPPASFVEMLAQGVGSLRVVVLSACDSDEHVRALAAAFPGLEVIGFVGEVGVEPARVFSEQLYKALAGGATVAAGLAAVRAAVGEAVKAQIVASGPGRFQARPWSTVLGFAALLAGVASAALWAVFLWGSEIETKRESETSELTSIASTSEATGVNDTQETTTSTGATLTSEEPPEETTSTGATLTSEEPPAGTTGKAPARLPRVRAPTVAVFRSLIDGECRERFPHESAQVVVSWVDEGSARRLRASAYVGQPCGAASLCGCIKDAISAERWRIPEDQRSLLLTYNSDDDDTSARLTARRL